MTDESPTVAPDEAVEPTPPEPDQHPDLEPDPADDGSDDETTDIGKVRREAAKHRARAKDAETERDTLRDQLATQRRAILDFRAAERGVHSELIDAAHPNLDEFIGDAGHLDMDGIDKFVDQVRDRYGIGKGLRMKPNRAMGHSTDDAPAEKPSLSNLFRRT